MARAFRFFASVCGAEAESFLTSRPSSEVAGPRTINVNFTNITAYLVEEHVLSELLDEGLAEQVVVYYQVFGNQPARLTKFPARRKPVA
jgi:hypothetical protein